MDDISDMIDGVTQCNCIDVMRAKPPGKVDLILTDPPDLVNCHDRDGRSVRNDNNADWLEPAFAHGKKSVRRWLSIPPFLC